MIVRDAIDDYFASPKVMKGLPAEEIRAIVNWAHSKCPLDYSTDAPLPKWATNLMSLGRLPYRTRVKILMWHEKKIETFIRVKENKLKKKFLEGRKQLKELSDKRAAEQGIEPVDLDSLRGLIF